MAFGFPAYHAETLPAASRRIDLHELVLRAFEKLGWTARQEPWDSFSASLGLSFRSWSEKIRVEILADRRMSIISSCALPTQCFDWGKNEKNVKAFVAELEVLLALQKPHSILFPPRRAYS